MHYNKKLKLRREMIKKKSEKEDGWKTVREERKLEREQKMKENIRKEEAWTNIRNTIKFLEEKVPEWKEEDLDDDLLRHESLEKDKFIRRRLKKRLKYKFLKKDQFKRELEKVKVRTVIILEEEEPEEIELLEKITMLEIMDDPLVTLEKGRKEDATELEEYLGI